MSASGRNLLVIGDYPIGFANGIGETLGNLLAEFPDERLFQLSPSHFAPLAGRARGQSLPFAMPRRPAAVPAVLHGAYYPVLKVQQALAERALVRQATRVIQEHGIGAVLTYPVTPWVLFAAVRLRRRFPGVRFVFYVMDDWEGHHTCFGLPFTPRRRAALTEMVATANARFACSERMRVDYEQRFGNAWQVLHKGVPEPVLQAPRPLRQPWRILYSGGLNVFRADAVMAFVAGLARFRQATGHDVRLTMLGAAADAGLVPALADYDFVTLEPWVDADVSRQRQAEADMLYLPLSLLPRVSRIAELAMPTKLGEYLATGRPIVFHVPAQSEVSRLAEAAGLVPVLSTLAPEEVCAWLMRLHRDGVDIEQQQDKALRLLREEFDEGELRARLLTACFDPVRGSA